MSDCRFGVSPVNYPDPDPDPDPSLIGQVTHRIFLTIMDMVSVMNLDLFVRCFDLLMSRCP